LGKTFVSDIIAVIRNEQGVGMSSMDGELIVVLLAMGGIVIDQQPVMMRSGIAIFGNLPSGSYTVLGGSPQNCDIELS
jgi:hypothetical protein